MTSSEVIKIKGHVRSLYEFYGKRAECTEDALHIYVEALLDYDFRYVEHALKEIVKVATFMPKPSEVINLVQQIQGSSPSDEKLELYAGVLFRELMKGLDIGQDIVSDDWRFVYAVRMAFTSLLNLGRSTEDDHWLEKKFVKAYMTADNPNIFGNVLGGMFHNTKDPRVRYIGNKAKCEQIAREFYGERGMSPRIARPTPKPQLAFKQQKQLELKHKDEYVNVDEVKGFIKQLVGGLNGCYRSEIGKN